MPEVPRTRSVISLKLGGPTIWTRLIQFGVVFLFFGGMIGAFCYAILNGENTKHEGSESVIRDASSNFSVFWTQYSDSGECINIRQPNKTKSKESDEPPPDDSPGKKFPSYWYQDNDEERLIYRTDPSHVAYVYKTHTFWTVIDDAEVASSCKKDSSLNYTGFIERMGLYKMYNRHSEIRQLARNAKVFVYDGEPPSKPLRNDLDLPLFIRAYADYETGVLRGFDTFYGIDATSGIFHTQCWFDEMKSNKPPAAAWGTLPSICEN
uniref:Uncharacterized protein n=1 Tax=Panagrolaimus superbus TaxID=310955 RepID=A0A914Y9H2_9BILA